MKFLSPLKWLILILSISLTLNQTKSIPKPTQTQPTSNNLTIPTQLTKLLHQWRNQGLKSQKTSLKPAAPVYIAGICCFLASSISSAGGIGGGGLFIPILTILAGLDLKTASSFSSFMVTGGSIANVLYNLCGKNNLVDYDIALLSEPCMLLGVSIGVICNVVFPEWLITILFAIFLGWSTFKTVKNGIFYWKKETEIAKRNGCEEGDFKSLDEPLMIKEGGGGGGSFRFPWRKMGVLVMIWFSFFLVYLLRGNRYGQGITKMEPCGLAYWALSLVQVPLAIAFTAWILRGRETLSCQVPVQQVENSAKLEVVGEIVANRSPKMLTFPLMALSAGILGGVFGIGGGMLISPLLLQVGIGPEVTAATCSFMVFFSSTMSAFQYLLLGVEHLDTALVFAIICFVASVLGLFVVQKLVKDFGRASIIVFSVGTVMALSTILMTSFGALDVWEDYTGGKYMGFKRPC